MNENLELREWIAVHVMGRVHFVTNDKVILGHVGGVMVECPHYETDIADAWLIVEAMRARGWDFGLDHERYRKPQYHAAFNLVDNLDTWRGEHAPTAPMAICLAAKAALEGTR